MRILVCGTRTWKDAVGIKEALDEALDTLKPGDTLTIIEGGAKGADQLAGGWAEARADIGVLHKCFPADWDKFGKRAGYIRNVQMLQEGEPDLVIAFWDGKSKGTGMMIALAEAWGVKVNVYTGQWE